MASPLSLRRRVTFCSQVEIGRLGHRRYHRSQGHASLHLAASERLIRPNDFSHLR